MSMIYDEEINVFVCANIVKINVTVVYQKVMDWALEDNNKNTTRIVTFTHLTKWYNY